MTDQLRILYVAAEVAPFVKVGGLADVAGALPKALRELGHDVRIIMPRYRQIDGARHGLRAGLAGEAYPVPGSSEVASLFEAESSGVPVYLVANEHYFGRERVYGEPDDVERFLYFCRAALAAVERLGWMPDVVNCNDWHTAAIPHWMRTRSLVPSAASVITIHNLAYQGGFDPAGHPDWIDPSVVYRRADGGVDLLSQAIHDADIVTTVSERYAHEITTPEYGEGLQDLLTSRQNDLRGIVNGIDYEVFDPARDPAIVERYSADALDGKAACKLALQGEAGFDPSPRTPLVGMIGRLADQKGFDLVAQVLEPLLAETETQVVLLGTGEPDYHDLFRELAAHNRRQLSVWLTFDGALAQRIYAGSDMFLMPSRFEPCGLGQLISLRYGTVPVVRFTGGLADTVADYQPATERGTGFVFRNYHPISLTVAMGRALEVYRAPDRWRAIQLRGMAQDLSWDASAHRYLSAYGEAIDRARRRTGAPTGA
jgi:starch synthase